MEVVIGSVEMVSFLGFSGLLLIIIIVTSSISSSFFFFLCHFLLTFSFSFDIFFLLFCLSHGDFPFKKAIGVGPFDRSNLLWRCVIVDCKDKITCTSSLFIPCCWWCGGHCFSLCRFLNVALFIFIIPSRPIYCYYYYDSRL